MSKQLPLKINIPRPCSENWVSMEEKENGRFCENCGKTVIDFSGLTDKELYTYFLTIKNIPCGRFHNDQLNKNILPVNRKKSSWRSLYKAAATLLAFLSLKYTNAAGKKNEAATTIQPSSPRQQWMDTNEKTIISGVVKDHQGLALENAEIRLGETLIAKTNKEGKFEFEIPDNQAGKPFLLSIHYPGLVSVARSYHPLMQSTSYTVTLESPPPPSAFHTIGVISIDETIFETIVYYRQNDKDLTKETKTLLSELAIRMRNHPEVSFTIIAYPKNNNDRVCKDFQSRVKKYLSEDEGIGDDRLNLVIQPYSTDKKNSIEIKAITY
jgi:hypothetical protein